MYAHWLIALDCIGFVSCVALCTLESSCEWPLVEVCVCCGPTVRVVIIGSIAQQIWICCLFLNFKFVIINWIKTRIVHAFFVIYIDFLIIPLLLLKLLNFLYQIVSVFCIYLFLYLIGYGTIKVRWYHTFRSAFFWTLNCFYWFLATSRL